jgi:hypothetical protein
VIVPRDYIALERTFYPVQEGERTVAIWFSLAGRGELRWQDLLRYWRVVILAEGGSGKSAELEQAARAQIAAGHHAFFGRLVTVAQKGLPAGLELSGDNFDAWKSSGETAWLFLDSVDEAKGERVRMSDAFRTVAKGIEGAASRIHIVLSGRFTDWEAHGDLALFKRDLTWVGPVNEDAPVDPDKLLLEIVSGEARRQRRSMRQEADDTHDALVVGLSPMSPTQVEIYAQARGVTDVASFVEAVEAGNLGTFVRRPMDLDWLVAYWSREGQFARFETMLEANLRQRLKEPDNHRRRGERFSEETGLRALERIGAALVLGRADEIVIPDRDASQSQSARALALDQILPDWDHAQQVELLNRPVFDPAREGHVRLHNDNGGEVRAYLAARWLHRLYAKGDGHLSVAAMMRLLFSTSYDVPLVKPSMRATAAWLSLWVPAVRERVLAVDPRLLMDAGDAAGLPRSAREQALERWTEEAKDAQHIGLPDRRALARFAQFDLAAKVRTLWKLHEGEPAARSFLLFAIQAGKLVDCADLAESAATCDGIDEDGRTYGTLALLDVGNDEALGRLARYVHANANGTSASIVWRVVEALYPRYITDDELLDIMRDTYKADNRQIERFEYVAPTLANTLDQPDRIEYVLKGILKLAQLHRPARNEQRSHERRDRFVATIEAFGERLLELSPPTRAPGAAIDAAIDAKYERRFRPLPSREDNDLYARLNATAERREASLWHAAARFPATQQGEVDDIFTLQHLGFAPDLLVEDATWLLKAARSRALNKDRRLAANAVLRLSVVNGRPTGPLLTTLQKISETDPEVAEVVRIWTTPRMPTADDIEHEREMKKIERRHALERISLDDGWLKFAANVRAAPESVRTPASANPGAMSNALFGCYQLLYLLAHEDNRYAISSVDPLRPILGDAAAEVTRQALMAYWRTWQPTLRAEKPETHAYAMSNGDRLGLAGITIEATSSSDWAHRLTPADAETAALYALLELNGFPDWIEMLAKAHRDVVANVLARALRAEIAPTFKGERNILRKLSRTSPAVATLVQPVLVKTISEPEDLPESDLSPVLETLTRAADLKGVEETLVKKVRAAKTVSTQVPYLAALFRIAPDSATTALNQAVLSLPEPRRAALVQAVLPRMFGDGTHWGTAVNFDKIPVEDLEEMVRLAFAHVRIEDDLEHLGVYSPTERDDAETARNRLLGYLVNRHGPYTFYALGRLQREPDHLGIPMANLASMAYTRAAMDAESSPWPPSHVYRFEQDALMLPRTSQDLQTVAIGAIDDLQLKVLSDDNSLARIVAKLPREREVQQWVRDQVEERFGRAFGIEREPHVYDEKEPDLRLSSRVTSAKSPIEIKRSTWTLEQLEDAITKQLVGRYLKNSEYRFGILLLVHQKSRPRGWKRRRGKPFTFEQVVAQLRALAASISAASATAAQVEVVVLDVSR